MSPLRVNPLLNKIARTTTSYLAPRKVTSLRPEIHRYQFIITESYEKASTFTCNSLNMHSYTMKWHCINMKTIGNVDKFNSWKKRHYPKTNSKTTTTNPQNHKPTNPNPKTPHKDVAKAIYEISTYLIVYILNVSQ